MSKTTTAAGHFLHVTIGDFQIDASGIDDAQLCSLFTHLATSLATKSIATSLAEVALSMGAAGKAVTWRSRVPDQSIPRV